MNRRQIITTISLLLVFCLLVAGCTMPFRRPAPEREPERTPTPTPAPDPQTPPPRTQQVDPQRDTDDVANRVADLASNVQGVDSSVVVVISNLALVGITIDRGEADSRDPAEIKQEVATQIEENERSVVNAYVSANPDIVRQLQEISAGVQRGEPISTFFDQITDVLERMRAEGGNEQN
jgi:YhcN/YlaJ family sporulation lipoprotein